MSHCPHQHPNSDWQRNPFRLIPQGCLRGRGWPAGTDSACELTFVQHIQRPNRLNDSVWAVRWCMFGRSSGVFSPNPPIGALTWSARWRKESEDEPANAAVIADWWARRGDCADAALPVQPSRRHHHRMWFAQPRQPSMAGMKFSSHPVAMRGYCGFGIASGNRQWFAEQSRPYFHIVYGISAILSAAAQWF